MRKKRQGGAEEVGFGTTAPSPRLTPGDVQGKEFRLAFRGYNERDVDAFLDQVTEEIGAYVDENRELREQLAQGRRAGPAEDLLDAEPAAPAPDTEQAIAEARAEAARIVAEARQEADRLRAAAAAGGSRTAETRAVIAPFLSRERDFLQNLGRLVQDHAEIIRGMVQSARDGQVAERPEPIPEPEGDDSPGTEGGEPITVPEARVEGEPEDASDHAGQGGEASSVGASTEATDDTEGHQRSRSLRELFWEED